MRTLFHAVHLGTYLAHCAAPSALSGSTAASASFIGTLRTIVTSTDRLRKLAWTLVLCSIPLASTGIRNYLSGDVLSTGVSGFYRIEGYMGGSGLTSNPNDLALMLNLIVPIAGVLVFISRGFAR